MHKGHVLSFDATPVEPDEDPTADSLAVSLHSSSLESHVQRATVLELKESWHPLAWDKCSATGKPSRSTEHQLWAVVFIWKSYWCC